MHLVLTNPVSKKSGIGASKNSNFPPLSLSFIAAATPSNYRITIIDENMGVCTYPEADLVGITGYTSSINRGYQIASEYRKKGVPVVMGGIHVSMLPDEALRYCDCVVTGEAEEIWPTVLKDFENGSLKPLYKGGFADIKSLPLPRRDLLLPNYTWGTLQTSRGCPMSCNFCSVTAFNGRQFRRRSMDDVILELQQIKQRLIFLIDDNILGFNKKDRDWLFEFFKRVQKIKPKKYFLAQSSIQIGGDPELLRLANKAGVKTIFIGMESIEENTLESFNKNLNASMLKKNKYFELIKTIRECGVGVLGAFILGGDADTIGSFKKTYDFIIKSGIDVLQMTKPTPLPGTKFYEMLDSENRIMNKDYPAEWDNYRFTRMLFKPHNLSVNDVYEGYAWLKTKFYSWPVKINRFLRTLLDTKDIITAIMVIKLNNAYEVAFRSSEIFDDDHNMEILNEKFNNN